MPRPLTAFAVLALVVGACGGGAAATSAPTVAAGEPASTEAAPPEVTEAPAETTSGGGGGGSGQSADSLKALAQELTPAGSTETGHLETEGVYQLYLTTTQNLDQLKAFYDGKAASIPIKDYTKVDASGSLYIGGSDPVLGIIAAPDPANNNVMTVVISVGG